MRLAILPIAMMGMFATAVALAQNSQPPNELPAAAAPLPQQFVDEHSVAVEVTAVSGDSVYLNQGRAAGLRPRDKVILTLSDGSTLSLTIEAIARNNARCILAPPNPLVSIGTRGTSAASGPPAGSAAPPPANTLASPPPPEPPTNPDHPRWSYDAEQWSSNQPLLAPPRALLAHERTTEIHGQLFSQYLHTWNWQSVDNQYAFSRTGTDLVIQNPFGDGGRIRFRGDLDIRAVNLFDGAQAVDTVGRVTLMSYAWGDQEYQPHRLELGRFLPSEFPEFGFLDGVEWVHRATDRQRWGISAGAMPEPFPSFQSWDDLQAAIFYRFNSEDQQTFCGGVGYQKTWHDGTPDRDLMVLRADFMPSLTFHAHGTIWTDFYNSADTLKSDSWEITEALFSQTWQFTPRAGMGTYYVQLRWPQLLRREIEPIFALQILRNRRSSYGAYTWRDLWTNVRLNGRVDRWENQDSLGGTTWESELYLRQVGDGPTDLAVAFLMTDGLYVSGPGGRVTLLRHFPRGLASVTYTAGDYRLTDEAQRMLNQGVVASLDFYFPSGHSFSLLGDYRFGESQDAASLGLIYRKRF